MRLKKFFFDLLYVRENLVARHPDFFYIYDEYYITSKSLEKLVSIERGHLVTDKNEYIVQDGVLFKIPWGNGEAEVKRIVESDVWNYLKNAGKIYYVTIEPGKTFFTVYYIVDGRFVYPARVEKNLIIQYLPNGYVSTSAEDFQVIKSMDEMFELSHIYNYSFTDDSILVNILENIRSVKGSKIILYPGMGIIWKGAYTVKIDNVEYKMIDPIEKVIDDPLLVINMPYLASFLI